jgi:hypothetical protein
VADLKSGGPGADEGAGNKHVDGEGPDLTLAGEI